MKQVVFHINIGTNSIIGTISNYFNHNIPHSVFGLSNQLPREYAFYFFVPKNEVEEARNQCNSLELRSFYIIPSEGMIIGG